MKKIFLFIVLLYSGLNLTAQSLHGIVSDTATGVPIEGIVVYIPQLKLGATTNKDGYYKIADVPKGTYDVETQYPCYATSIKHVTIDSATKLDFALDASCACLQEAIITSLGNQTTNL